uniref:Uncharacterized protein n=1 Tax=viral metagenome TaxID=1070528 RepID=A0A6C0EKB7_9ZZZZ
MPSILIDYEKIITEKHTLLQKKLLQPPKASKGFLVGLVLVTSEENVREISKLPAGRQRIEFLNSPHFVNSLINYTYVLHNTSKEVCLLNPDCASYVGEVLPALFAGLSAKTILWVSIDVGDANCVATVKKFAKNGFNSPYITNMSPLRVSISPSIALVRLNVPTEQYNASATLNKVLHAIKEYKGGDTACSLKAQLAPRAISFLRKASKMGITINGDGKKSQKELTGELFVSNVEKNGNNFIYIIDIDEGSVESGAEEDVNVNATRYNFHSHPQEAYVRHRVDKAWPSLTDYLGFLKLGTNTIFHCVATLEGVYVMSFGPYWGRRLKKVSKSFVQSHYDIDHRESHTPQEYAQLVNNIKYKGQPIYHVEFIPWTEAGKVFNVSYSKIGLSCIATEKGHRSYRKLYK